MKRSYLTDEFYEKAQHIIYNDLPTVDLYDVSGPVDDFREDVVKQIVLPKEKWKQITTVDGRTHLAYTSYARLINTQTIRILSCSITRLNILHCFNSNNLRSTDLFEEFGWEHDIEKLQKRYKQKGWKYSYNFYDEL